MSFLDDIRKQPQHHREIMFSLCVVTTISLVGMVWYNSFQQNLYVLLNPDQTADQRFLAENKDVPSLLGNISQTGKDLKAAFYSILNLNSSKTTEQADDIQSTNTNDSGKVYMLPLSEEK